MALLQGQSVLWSTRSTVATDQRTYTRHALDNTAVKAIPLEPVRGIGDSHYLNRSLP